MHEVIGHHPGNCIELNLEWWVMWRTPSSLVRSTVVDERMSVDKEWSEMNSKADEVK
jgi:DMSO/TMAO reductase YedYZ molybdopterin-dependent catalytic subunit